MKEERMLTPRQAADRLQVREATVTCWLRTGKLPGVKIGKGKLWRIPETAVTAGAKG